jgi:hypothetical protein
MKGQAVRVPIRKHLVDDLDRCGAVRGFEARISQRLGAAAEDAAVKIVRFGDEPAAAAAAADDEIERGRRAQGTVVLGALPYDEQRKADPDGNGEGNQHVAQQSGLLVTAVMGMRDEVGWSIVHLTLLDGPTIRASVNAGDRRPADKKAIRALRHPYKRSIRMEMIPHAAYDLLADVFSIRGRI